jgi:chromatin modification-related protein EAF6
MEEFTTAEKKLNEMLAKKRALDKQIATIQVSIYALETAYLEETPYGNVVKVNHSLRNYSHGGI